MRSRYSRTTCEDFVLEGHWAADQNSVDWNRGGRFLETEPQRLFTLNFVPLYLQKKTCITKQGRFTKSNRWIEGDCEAQSKFLLVYNGMLLNRPVDGLRGK